jgi:hypothetical protein
MNYYFTMKKEKVNMSLLLAFSGTEKIRCSRAEAQVAKL